MPDKISKHMIKPLFIFELANNHCGNLEHGLTIIRKFHDTVKDYKEFFNFGFKLQYRHLDTFIHPDFKDRNDIKYVKRFLDTRLAPGQFKMLKDEMTKLGFISICTPFDEESVDLIIEHSFDIIKVASCSFTDWPLLERIASTDKPLILSTAGASLEEIDQIAAFLDHRNKSFCLMHCIGEYPTLDKQLQLNQLDLFRQRYPQIPAGFSTHEDPANTDAVKIAIAKGACTFERHVGIPMDKYPLNAYSSNPEQIRIWLDAAKKAFDICGVNNRRHDISAKEKEDLRGLKRGVFAGSNIDSGTRLNKKNIFLAIPNQPGQLLANDLSKYTEYTLKINKTTNAPILLSDLEIKNLRADIIKIVQELKKLIKASGIKLQNKMECELSHHYGVDKFFQYGCAIISCVNREYCKKIIMLLPGQCNPVHVHKKKEETFHVLYGEVVISLGETEKMYKEGELIVVERNVPHSFKSENGAVLEEISTTHYTDDSYYSDSSIMDNKDRKTRLTFWADWMFKDIR